MASVGALARRGLPQATRSLFTRDSKLQMKDGRTGAGSPRRANAPTLAYGDTLSVRFLSRRVHRGFVDSHQSFHFFSINFGNVSAIFLIAASFNSPLRKAKLASTFRLE